MILVACWAMMFITAGFEAASIVSDSLFGMFWFGVCGGVSVAQLTEVQRRRRSCT